MASKIKELQRDLRSAAQRIAFLAEDEAASREVAKAIALSGRHLDEVSVEGLEMAVGMIWDAGGNPSAANLLPLFETKVQTPPDGTCSVVRLPKKGDDQ